jgi:hypothetical protein
MSWPLTRPRQGVGPSCRVDCGACAWPPTSPPGFLSSTVYTAPWWLCAWPSEWGVVRRLRRRRSQLPAVLRRVHGRRRDRCGAVRRRRALDPHFTPVMFGARRTERDIAVGRRAIDCPRSSRLGRMLRPPSGPCLLIDNDGQAITKYALNPATYPDLRDDPDARRQQLASSP